MYKENQNILSGIEDLARVAKSKWQTADGKWWTNDGSGKKPYTPKSNNKAGGKLGGAPLTSAGVDARRKQQSGALSSTEAEARAKRLKREEAFKKIPQHMLDSLNDKTVPEMPSSKPAQPAGTSRPAHSIKNVKMVSPRNAMAMYKQHINSDPEFAKHESERVGAMMGTGKASLSELNESIDKTDPMDAHRDINEAYTSYYAKKNPSA